MELRVIPWPTGTVLKGKAWKQHLGRLIVLLLRQWLLLGDWLCLMGTAEKMMERSAYMCQ